jgi:N-acetylglucosamine-6-sulfatase
VTGYSTELIGKYTLNYIDDAIKSKKPFFVTAAPIAPHVAIKGPSLGIAVPEKKYDGKFPNLRIPRAPNFNPDKASYSSRLPNGTFFHTKRRIS